MRHTIYNHCVWFLVLLAVVSCSQTAATTTTSTKNTNDETTAQVPATLVATALNHAVQSGLGEEIVSKVYDQNVDALYLVAKIEVCSS